MTTIMTESYTYPAHISIAYENDDEYRESICRLFRQNTDSSSDPTTSEYTDDEFYALIHYIETHTGTIPEFRTLYVASAAHLMSEEIQVGIVVLLSYDYLFDFHILLCEHFAGTLIVTDTTSTYTKLLRTIQNHTTR